MTRAGIYSRQSRDSTKSIDDQARENRAAVDEQGWQVAVEYSDGSSASRFARKARDEWQRVLADVAARAFDVLVLWESSRGDRTPETWLALLTTCRKRGVLIHVVTHHRTYDMRNPRDWRTLAEDGIDNAYESEKISLRVRRGLASAASAGRPTHGRCPDGYRRVYDERTGALIGQEIDPERAPIVRDIITRAAKGEPISTIVASLNARGVPTIGAERWYRVRVRDIAINPAYRAARMHNGEEHPAGWPALVDDATWYAAYRVLTDPRRVTTRPGRQVHLLTYLGTCEPCGAPLTAVRGRYRCWDNGCVTIVEAPTDRLVEDHILGRLSRPDVYESLRRAGADTDQQLVEARAEAARLRGQLAAWRLSAAKGKTSPESLAVIEADLTTQIRAADRHADRTSIPPALRQILKPGADVRTRWAGMPLPARRDVIRTLAVITVRPAVVPGGRLFDPQRLAGSRWAGDPATWGDHWAA